MPLSAPATRSPPAPGGDALAGGAGLLVGIAAELSQGADLADVLSEQLQPLLRLSGARAAAVRTLAADGEGPFQLVSAIGLPSHLPAGELEASRHCGACGQAAQSGAVVWAGDLSVCARHLGHAPFGASHQRMLTVPLQYRGQVRGVYNLFFGAEQPEPAPDVQAMLKAVGELLGMALHSAQLEREQWRMAVENERQMLAAEVHDSLGQALTFIKMRLPLLEDALAAPDSAQALAYCAELRGTVTQAHASLRTVLTHMRSPPRTGDLVAALRDCAEGFRLSTGCELDLCNEWPTWNFTADQENHVFHIVQEALNNISRHAAASHAAVRLHSATAGQAAVTVEDDGVGLDAAHADRPTHYGLEIMRERARRLGGHLDIAAREGGGTRIHLVFPHVPAPSSRLQEPAP